MNVFNIISLLGGLGMFLYGMKVMGDGLEKTAGDKLKSIIESLTGNIFKGVLVGTLVTALIQSSSATTVMVVGFVNAGMMTLGQAVGVIMGANIGTTVTAQILRLGDISSNAWYLQMLKPETLAPVAIAVGVMLIFSGGTKKKRADVGEIITGFGVLFIGMQNMEHAVSALRDLPQFQQLFSAFAGNPFLGILAGAGVTAIIQSSSASVGILQAVANTGFVSFASAVPIIMGQNIGTCITALLSSIGASKNARKAAMVHLYFNIIGTIIFTVGIYVIQNTVGFSFWNKSVNRGDIADFHTLFNITNTLLLIPFASFLVYLANKTIKGKDKKTERANYLEKRLLNSPSLAIGQSAKQLVLMLRIAKENVDYCKEGLMKHNTAFLTEFNENENHIDRMEIEITNYLTQIVQNPLNNEENKVVAGYLRIVNDIERIGDNIDNVAEALQNMVYNGIKFSDKAMGELQKLIEAVQEILDINIEALEKDDLVLAQKIEPLEEVIDDMKDKLRSAHIERLAAQKCDAKAGIYFLEMVNNFERIADHSSNMGVVMMQQKTENPDFNSHDYLRKIHSQMPDSFRENYEAYKTKYLS